MLLGRAWPIWVKKRPKLSVDENFALLIAVTVEAGVDREQVAEMSADDEFIRLMLLSGDRISIRVERIAPVLLPPDYPESVRWPPPDNTRSQAAPGRTEL